MTPQSRRLLDWLAVGLGSLAILLAAPIARLIQAFVSERFGRALIGYAVLAALAAVFFGLVIRLVVRREAGSWPRLAWLTIIAAIFVYFTWTLRSNPEEAIHFLEYGALGFLLFRAWRHSFPNVLVYPAAFLLGCLVGLADEILQWILPNRLWDVRDLELNALAVGLVQLGLALSIKPPGLNRPADIRSGRRISGLMAVLLLVFGLCLSNTPEAVEAYSDLIPALSFLREQEPMRQAAILHQDPQVGRFSSRLTLDWLHKTDLVRSGEFASILRQWGKKDYAAFLRAFPSSGQPFLHEFRVRLFRRDRKEAAAGRTSSVRDRREAILAAVKENMILEKYFGRTLRASGYAWPPEKKNGLESQVDPSRPYRSPVGGSLLTGVSLAAVWAVLGAILLFLLGFNIAWPIIARKRKK